LLGFVAGGERCLFACSKWNHEVIHFLVPTNKDHPRICHDIKKE